VDTDTGTPPHDDADDIPVPDEHVDEVGAVEADAAIVEADAAIAEEDAAIAEEAGPAEGEVRELPKRVARIADKAAALAAQEVEEDHDKAPEVTGEPIDPGARRLAIGVDVGGSGIKAAAVDLDTGELVSERHRVPTPQPSSPAAVIASIARMVKKIGREVTLGPDVPVGVGFPGVVIDGITRSAANVDPGWVDFDADAAMERVLGRPVHLVNDADAAGVAEMRFGAGVGRRGTVFLITLGTGTGSALFYNGMLVPNLELGHMEIRGRDAERRSAAAARLRRGLSWKAWAQDLDEHLLAIEKLFSPRLFIIGGGVSKRGDQFIPRLTVRAEVVPAKLRNDAGIVGTAMAAAEAELAERA
jgi:polyphosphate glucokinase